MLGKLADNLESLVKDIGADHYPVKELVNPGRPKPVSIFPITFSTKTSQNLSRLAIRISSSVP